MDMSRLLKPLSLLAIGTVALAVFAGVTDRRVNSVAPPEVFLPAYGAALGEAARLEITHGLGLSGTRVMSFTRQDGVWVFEQRANYPAKQELVTETLLALADIKVLEARTAKSQWHRALGLSAPEDFGKAVRFRVLNAAGDELASVLLGNEERSEAEASLQLKSIGPDLRNFYIRRETQDQTWLARGRLPRSPEASSWISMDLPRGPADLLKSVSFGRGPSAFQLAQLGAGQWSRPGGLGWFVGFADLQPDNVTPEDTIAFDTAQPMTLRYANGLIMAYENVGAANYIWSRVQISASKKASAEIQTLASDLQARYSGWAFRFPAETAPILLPGAAQLDKPLSR
jgi:hypothetical protein